MKNQKIRFSKGFIPAAVFSSLLIIAGITGYITRGGFNLGIDFQAGLIQEIQFARSVLALKYSGAGNVSVSMNRNGLNLVVTGAGVEEQGHSFAFAAYPTLIELARALNAVEGVDASLIEGMQDAKSEWLLMSAQSSPTLEAARPFELYYLSPGEQPIRIEDVRAALAPLGTVAVQVLGNEHERRFMIRMEDRVIESSGGGVPSDRIIAALENTFGAGEIAVTRSDYVGSRFSKNLSDQVGILLALTLLLMLAYMSFRFKLRYALAAVIGIAHDGIVIIAFVAWTRMEFNTSTIAAILTILGYSANNTIVVFDRIRENLRIFPDESFVDVLNRSLTGTLGRTIITTVSTMLAVLSLFIFTTGAMKDFALALLVGMTSGVYTTMFIASGFVFFWEAKRAKKLAAAPKTAQSKPAKS